MDDRERRILQKLKDDYVHYASKCLKIRTKAGDVLPFVLNKAQRYIHDMVEDQLRRTGKVRVIIVKGRQVGASTYTEGRFYWKVTHRFGVRAFILTHAIDATNNLFEMAKRFHENCPEIVRPEIQSSNAKELSFGYLDSGYKLGTAGNKSVGRSSTIQFLHCSEVAYFANADEHAKGILQAVPNDPGTEIFLESTANGVSNYFHEQWQLAEAGDSDFIPIFIPWYWQPEYQREVVGNFELSDEEMDLKQNYQLSDEQLNWRRYKIKELSVSGMDGYKAFCAEYPCSAAEAFITTGLDSYIPPNIVTNARKNHLERIGKLIIGVDPARQGSDKTAIIRRVGRVAYNLQTFTKMNTMEVCGIIHKMILEEKPFKVCIDVVGIGAGVIDRLRELGHYDIILPVNGGEVALDASKYGNKRAELWSLMKLWLEDGPVQIPDSDLLQGDLCGLQWKPDSKHRIMLEKKEMMRKRGLRSPDCGDALSYTFACTTGMMQHPTVNNELIVDEMAREFARIRMMKASR